MSDRTKYKWLEFKPRPKRDGLHDSGYRFISLTGINLVAGVEVRTPLHQWSDHVVLNGPVNIDVTESGIIRIIPWLHKGWISEDNDGSFYFYSSAMFDVVEKE